MASRTAELPRRKHPRSGLHRCFDSQTVRPVTQWRSATISFEEEFRTNLNNCFQRRNFLTISRGVAMIGADTWESCSRSLSRWKSIPRKCASLVRRMEQPSRADSARINASCSSWLGGGLFQAFLGDQIALEPRPGQMFAPVIGPAASTLV